MMHLLRKYDVAPFGRNDAMFAQCAVRHTSLGEAVIIGVAVIICRRQTSFKKRTFVGRQKFLFCWQGQKDSILARTARSVFRGSDSPPDCHSLPLPFESFLIKTKRNNTLRASFLFVLAGAEGLEPTTHGFGDQYSTN